MKKLIIFVFCSILVVSCTTIKKENKVKIIVGIDKYSPIMSSVPGIPLIPEYYSNENSKTYMFQWITEQGHFIKWDDNYKIIQLENIVKNNGEKIFWSIDFEQKEEETPFRIWLKVIDLETENILGETKVSVEKNNEGFYVIKK
ncbi:hypothetical protein [Marispirochaeta sp.]|uniref:hypothetical protein n=1 Tax=Marispirochaeta sp. TaxID=2038653 RepID=UPI0029C94398|nr:hypothetical protein [Marispirochaeta sp.]